jgi:hypothetical protein
MVGKTSNRPFAAALLGLLLGSSACAMDRVPVPKAPADGFSTVVFHPSFSWELPMADDVSVEIQMATDSEFKNPVDTDTIHSVVDWYVPAKPLKLGRYWWRLRCVQDGGRVGRWSGVRDLSVVSPQKTFVITPSSSLAEIQKTGAEAARAESALIRFEKGTYRLKPGFEEPVFSWTHVQNIIVEGGGSRVIMEEPSAQFWKVENCHNILIGNFSYEYDPRPHTLARVVATDAIAGTLDAEFVEGFSGVRYPRVVNQMFCYALNPEDPRKLHPDRPGHLYLDPEKTVEIQPGLLRYVLPHANEFPLLDQMKKGDRIVVCYRRWPLSYVQRCEDVTLFDIQLIRSEAPYFMGGGNRDMKFLGLSAPSEDGWAPSPAGWVTGNDRHGPWIEGCFFEAIADDGPNITGNAYLIKEQSADDRFVLQTGPYWQNAIWKKGDRLLFWDPVKGLPLQTVVVKDAASDREDLRKGLKTVRVSKAVAGVVPGMDFSVNTHIYNLSCKNSGFTARNNRLVCGRRFGFNIKADNVLVEKNYFEGLSSSAVYLENAPTFWEGPASENVVIQNNEMIRCGDSLDSAQRRRASGVHVNLWRYPSNGGYETPWVGHENILIRNNRIIDWESVGIAVDNVHNARVVNNTFENKALAGFLLKENAAVWIGDDAEDVVEKGNKYFDDRAYQRRIRKPLQ